MQRRDIVIKILLGESWDLAWRERLRHLSVSLVCPFVCNLQITSDGVVSVSSWFFLFFFFFLQTPPRYPMGKSQISFLSWGDPASPLGLDGQGGDVSLVANDRREKMKLQTYGLVHDLICKPSETDKKQNKTRITSLTGNPDPKPCQGSMVETPDRRNGSSN